MAFSNYNRENNKYKIQLLIYDDQYNKTLTKKNVELLDHFHGMFALIGTVGTSTTVNVLDYVIEKNIPLLQPLTGSNLLRRNFYKNVIHTRPSYYDEVRLILQFIIKNQKKNISILYQDDDFGYSILNDINFILTEKYFINKISIISSSAYKSGAQYINNNFSELLKINQHYNIDEITQSK